jgi:hypothetical protein
VRDQLSGFPVVVIVLRSEKVDLTLLFRLPGRGSSLKGVFLSHGFGSAVCEPTRLFDISTLSLFFILSGMKPRCAGVAPGGRQVTPASRCSWGTRSFRGVELPLLHG